MSKLKQLRRASFFSTVVWIASLTLLPSVFGEAPWISAVVIGGWILIAACGLTYMYYFFRGEK